MDIGFLVPVVGGQYCFEWGSVELDHSNSMIMKQEKGKATALIMKQELDHSKSGFADSRVPNGMHPFEMSSQLIHHLHFGLFGPSSIETLCFLDQKLSK